jgi:hypothetical protein
MTARLRVRKLGFARRLAGEAHSDRKAGAFGREDAEWGLDRGSSYFCR